MAKRIASQTDIPVFKPEKSTSGKLVVVGKVRTRSRGIKDGQDELNALIAKAIEETGGTHIRAVVTVLSAPNE